MTSVEEQVVILSCNYSSSSSENQLTDVLHSKLLSTQLGEVILDTSVFSYLDIFHWGVSQRL